MTATISSTAEDRLDSGAPYSSGAVRQGQAGMLAGERGRPAAKHDARKILDGLPEEASLEDIQYHLYVLQRIERGREDVAAGRIVSQDEVEQRLAKWLDE